MTEDREAAFLTCPRCGRVLPDLSLAAPSVRREAAELVREGRRVHAAKVLAGMAGYDLADAWAVAIHLVRRPDRCNNCEHPLSGEEKTLCSRCGALNLRWELAN